MPSQSDWVGTWSVNETGGGNHQNMTLILTRIGPNTIQGDYWLSTHATNQTPGNRQGSLILSNKVTYGALEGTYVQPAAGSGPASMTGQTIFVIDQAALPVTFFGPWDKDIEPGEDEDLGTWSGTYVSSSTTPNTSG